MLLQTTLLLDYYNTVFVFSVFRFLYSANLRRKRQREATKQKKDEDWSALQTIDDDSQEFHLTLINAFSMVTAYLAAGVVLFSLWEEWSLFESFYFCFMTLTSIGKDFKKLRCTKFILSFPLVRGRPTKCLDADPYPVAINYGSDWIER